MTVTTDPSNVLPAGTSGGTWIVQNLGTEAIYIGRTASDANTTTGVKVAQFEAVEFDFSTSGTASIWARTATGTADVRVLKAD